MLIGCISPLGLVYYGCSERRLPQGSKFEALGSRRWPEVAGAVAAVCAKDPKGEARQSASVSRANVILRFVLYLATTRTIAGGLHFSLGFGLL